MHKTYQAKNFGIVCGKKNDRGGRNIFIFRSEIASGNTLGGMTCYWIGHLGKRDWITRYLRVEPAKIDRVSRFLEGKGALFAFFTFLPYVGEAVAIVLGLMRSNVWITAVAMFVGKLLRYVAIVAALQGVLSWF